jgi:hypothetical protein
VTVVEDTATGRIVSALFLVSQVWSYAGMSLAVGQPELVATHPDYRRRGLVRAQFRVIHQWSEAAGHRFQFIGGIPWYYRQFGYVYGLDVPPEPVLWLGAGKPAAAGEYAVRAATPADIPFLASVEAQAASGTALGPRRGEDGFALELARRPGGLHACEVLVVESRAPGRGPVGWVAHLRRLRDGLVSVRGFELRQGESWLEPTAAVVAHLDDWARSRRDGATRGIRFALPDGHAALRCLATRLSGGPPGSYGVYVRCPDVVALVCAVVPVLEARLARSPAVGWTGDLRIDLYTGGLRLHVDEGRIALVERWIPGGESEGTADARLTSDDLLQLVLGNRRIGELERTSADCLLTSDAGALLLDVLFPLMPASTWELC